MMGWDKLNLDNNKNQNVEVANQNAIDLAKAYHRLFKSEDGQKVLGDLTNRFIMNSHVEHGEQNINYVAAFQNGEANVVKVIINQIQRAEIL